MKHDVYVFGNPILTQDAMAVVVAQEVSKRLLHFNFIYADPTEELDIPQDSPLIILDTIIGLKDVKVFTDLSSFVPPPQMSVHDFDLYQHLLLRQKIGKLPKLTIIGVPENGDIQKLVNTVETIFLSSAF